MSQNGIAIPKRQENELKKNTFCVLVWIVRLKSCKNNIS